ncbi:hypothetical protein EXIGLDRAFT_705402 [Exidia glandulosa HHB12029]|uniref:Uncharacterized protein n=1 Tax=Exidia glandulosa HHB12029 TaxID=1314781 RepID=A0A165BDR8_EXIGL|nr:hypothetical protein EXIGLDRAFT_705402 [Exidia glandulosa HHB12029]
MNHLGASLPLSPVSARGPSLFPLPPSRPPSPQEDASTSWTQTPPSYPEPVSLLLELMAVLGNPSPDLEPSFPSTRDGAIVHCLKRQYGMLSGTTTPRSDAAEDSEESVSSNKDGISLDGGSLLETGTIGSSTAPRTNRNSCNAQHPSKRVCHCPTRAGSVTQVDNGIRHDKEDCGGTTDGSDGHNGSRSASQESDGDKICGSLAA